MTGEVGHVQRFGFADPEQRIRHDRDDCRVTAPGEIAAPVRGDAGGEIGRAPIEALDLAAPGNLALARDALQNYVGETPVAVDLSIRREHTITFRKDGYQDRSYQVSRAVGFGWILLDLFGLVPIIVDAATGDWFMLDTEHVNVIMAPTS